MILQSLVNYYEILANDENSDISKLGYCKANVSYAANISLEGELLNIIPLKIAVQRGKKIVEVPQSMEVPEHVKKSVGIRSNFLCENSSYLFGVDNKEKHERAKECFEAFKQLHINILQNVENTTAKAVINFVSNWDIDKAIEHPALVEYLDEILSGANFVFKINGGEFVHHNKDIRQAWGKYKSNSDNASAMQCLVTGKKSCIARLHPSIKGVKGAQSVGGSMVSFNSRAYESYGRDEQQGLNAPVSEYATFAYTTVLNYLLSDNYHKIYLGDATIVFWAESSNKIYQNFMSLYINSRMVNNDDENIVKDEKAANEIRSIFEKIAQGKPIDELSDALEEKIKFHILAISPNAARLAVRFFISNSFGEMVKKIAMHYQDMRIEKQYSTDPDTFSLWKLLNETVSPKSKDKVASPLMVGATLKAIITGAPYPESLYNSIMLRIKAEKDINYYKASIIKGYLYRNTNKFKEVLTMALNEQSNNKAYIFGRLFAVLEKAQLDANPKINTTIKDRYFTSACATPASVFPILLRLSQHHISNAEYGYTSDKRIANILEKLDIDNNPFPSNLLLDEQGVFILGYYHQKNSMYQKNNKKSEEN